MNNVEATRLSYRPKRIVTLFVGESAPAGGTFFYYGNSGLTRYMRKAIESAFPDFVTFNNDQDFLKRFRSYGWYLDDLVRTPVNRLEPAARKASHRKAQSSLAQRIAEYRPRAIVSLLKSIKDVVERAAVEARSSAELHSVPFAGFGRQGEFLIEMERLLPMLPRS